MTSKKRDYSNVNINGITAIEYIESKNKGVIWKFRCHCGKLWNTVASKVASGAIGSCGCNKGGANRKLSNYPAYNRLFISNHYKNKGISFDNFLILCRQNCFYCGASPKIINPYGSSYEDHLYHWGKRSCTKKRYESYFIPFNGIDKVIPTDDYSDLNNLVPCCRACNFFKAKLTQQDFLAHVKKINDYQESKNAII